MSIKHFILNSNFTVIEKSNRFECSCIHNKRITTFTLKKLAGGKFEIMPPNYVFHNRQSYLRYSGVTPTRITYDKTFMLKIIKDLKKTHLWDLIANQNFIEVNTECSSKKFSEIEVRGMLNDNIK